MPGVTIGDNTCITAGSIIAKHMATNEIYGGYSRTKCHKSEILQSVSSPDDSCYL